MAATPSYAGCLPPGSYLPFVRFLLAAACCSFFSGDLARLRSRIFLLEGELRRTLALRQRHSPRKNENKALHTLPNAAGHFAPRRNMSFSETQQPSGGGLANEQKSDAEMSDEGEELYMPSELYGSDLVDVEVRTQSPGPQPSIAETERRQVMQGALEARIARQS